jgi:hypothetical protein
MPQRIVRTTRPLPRPDMNTGANRLPGPVRHHIAVIETECPGVMEISCTCGEQTWTPWGAAHAQEIADVHLWANGQGKNKRTFVL